MFLSFVGSFFGKKRKKRRFETVFLLFDTFLMVVHLSVGAVENSGAVVGIQHLQRHALDVGGQEYAVLVILCVYAVGTPQEFMGAQQ